jgi:phosphoglycolate phosphatase
MDTSKPASIVAPVLTPARALIFDLDGTLIDSKRDLIESVNAMLKEIGREKLAPEVISGYIGHGAPVLVARALGAAATEEECARALQFFLAHYEAHKLDNTCAYRGVADTLGEFEQRKIPMAVLTNKPVRISVRILEALELAKYFRAIYGGNSFETKKPDPLGANNILAELGAAAREAMFVGDSEVDVQTARNAGTMAASVNYGFGVHDRSLYPADVYLDRFSELIPFVANGAGSHLR